jgi:hypothetical protein
MIDIKKLTGEYVGRHVVYIDGVGDKIVGRIKSWNDQWVFVVYHCADEWDNFQDYTAAATDPDDLCFVRPRPGEENIESRFDILDL